MTDAHEEKRPARSPWLVYGPLILLAIVVFFVTLQYVDPAPPREIRIATGRDGGGYQDYARRLAEQLAKSDLTLRIEPSAGSIENIERLRRGEVDIAFVQGGTADATTPEPEDDLLSVASVYYEPLWVFHRARLGLKTLAELKGKTIAVGPEGSGTRAVALQLLAENGIIADPPQIQPLAGTAAAEALMAGKLDAVFLVGASADAAVSQLLQAPDVVPFDFVRAEAYCRRHRYLSTVMLPRGAANLADDLPRRDVHLVAPTAQLVVREAFHPAVVDLILEAADTVFHGGDLVQAEQEFPSAKAVEYPLSPIAKRYFRSGRPFLYRYLPFRIAAFCDRMKILLLPLLTLIFPLVKLVPPVYRWRVRSRIYRWYRELLRIEAGIDDGSIENAEDELNAMAKEVSKLSVPPSYADDLYHLKHHIEVVRQRALRATT